jgi:hypothetical protein
MFSKSCPIGIEYVKIWTGAPLLTYCLAAVGSLYHNGVNGVHSQHNFLIAINLFCYDAAEISNDIWYIDTEAHQYLDLNLNFQHLYYSQMHNFRQSPKKKKKPFHFSLYKQLCPFTQAPHGAFFRSHVNINLHWFLTFYYVPLTNILQHIWGENVEQQHHRALFVSKNGGIYS